MRTLACMLVGAVLFIASASTARAAPFAYGVAFDELYRVDLGTRQATFIGVHGNYAGRVIGQVTALTYGPQGALYAASGNLKALVRINEATGAAEFIGSFGLDGQGSGQFDSLDLSMTYGCDGAFWMVSAINGNLWRVSAQTGATTLIGNTGRILTGLAARNGRLYATGIGSDQGLYTLDPATAAATRIGPLGIAAPWIEPDFGADGGLWATISYNPPENREWSDLARIDVATGTATNLGPITGPDSLRFFSMKGLAVAPTSCQPVPDGTVTATSLPVRAPWALLVLGLAIVALARRQMSNSRRARLP